MPELVRHQPPRLRSDMPERGLRAAELGSIALHRFYLIYSRHTAEAVASQPLEWQRDVWCLISWWCAP